MKKYWMFGGMGGGFGGPSYLGSVMAEDEDSAVLIAYEQAVEDYQSYEGYHGLLSYEDCLNEQEGDENAAKDMYRDEIESWISYWVVEVIPGIAPEEYLAGHCS